MMRCSLCDASLANAGQLDHYIEGHNIDPQSIWVTDAIYKNSGEALFTYKRIPLDLALSMDLWD